MKTPTIVMAFFAIGILAGCSKGESTPKVSFTPSKTTAYINEDISFANSTTGAKSYDWDFGDGGTSTLENPSHSYSKEGKYMVGLNAHSSSNHDGFGAGDEKEITILEEPKKITATIGGADVAYQVVSSNNIVYRFMQNDYTTDGAGFTYRIYHTFIGKSENRNCFHLKLGKLQYSGSAPTQTNYYEFIRNRTYAYSTNAASGVEILYYDAAGEFWSTNGIQTNSAFRLDNVAPDPQVAKNLLFKATFNCTLYNSKGQSMTLTNGFFHSNFVN